MRCKVTYFIEKNINNRTKNCIILGYLKKNEYFCTPNESENCLRDVLRAVSSGLIVVRNNRNNNKIK